MEGINKKAVFDVILKAALVNMMVIWQFKQGIRVVSKPTRIKKWDKTMFDEIDGVAGQAAVEILNELPAGQFDIYGEDAKGRKTPNARYLVMSDGRDGTRADANGMNSCTVITTVYDKQAKKTVFTLVGEPGSGRIWYAWSDEETQLIHYHTDLDYQKTKNPFTMGGIKTLTEPKPVKVWGGKLNQQATLVVDVNHGYTRKHLFTKISIPVLPSGVVNALILLIGMRGIKLLMPGSNGLQHALVANGGMGMVGCFTTAMLPWDGAGNLLPMCAGGCSTGITVTNPDTEGNIQIARCSPLNIVDCDMVLSANSHSSLKQMQLLLLDAITLAVKMKKSDLWQP